MAATAATTAPMISSVRPPAWTVSCPPAGRPPTRLTSARIAGDLLSSIIRMLRQHSRSGGAGDARPFRYGCWRWGAGRPGPHCTDTGDVGGHRAELDVRPLQQPALQQLRDPGAVLRVGLYSP